MPTEPIYSIGAVAAMIGMPVATLRTWEDRYGLVVPKRSAGGHRVFSREQVEQLRFMAERVAEGLSAADAHRLLSKQLSAGVALVKPREPESRVLVLLVDRDPYAGELAEYFLRTEGYDVVLVPDADSALERSIEDKPDIAVVDMLISGNRGLDLCRTLSGERGVRVISLSVLPMDDEAQEAGASACLRKPLDPLLLVSAVRDLLGTSYYLGSRR